MVNVNFASIYNVCVMNQLYFIQKYRNYYGRNLLLCIILTFLKIFLHLISSENAKYAVSFFNYGKHLDIYSWRCKALIYRWNRKNQKEYEYLLIPDYKNIINTYESCDWVLYFKCINQNMSVRFSIHQSLI